MDRAHFFHAGEMDWQPHPTIRGIGIKSLENSRTYENASVTLVQVAPGGVIEPHLHDRNFETAYVISGQAVLTLPDGETTLSAGDGVTIPPNTLHSLHNA